MSRAFWNIFLKEFRDVVKSRYFLVLCATLVMVVTLSLVISAIDFHAQQSDYQKYVASLQQAGMTPQQPPPRLSPLRQLRASIEYLEIIGAILAIVIGYGMIAKEKHRGTLQLLFSRPLGSLDIAAGKVAALAVTWFIVAVLLCLAVFVTMIFIGGAVLSAADSVKLGLGMGDAWVYLMFWSVLSLGLASLTRQLSTALLISFVVWLSVVLIIPQVGDTMDPDNQVPGGLFHSLHVDKTNEHAIMAHFNLYETTRNALEETSISKHFERASFAFLGVKEIYDQQPLAGIWSDTWKDSAWPLAGLFLGVVFALTQCNKRNLLGRK
ncbi:MAG: ABC transporter permease [Thermoleophilia bacterium]